LAGGQGRPVVAIEALVVHLSLKGPLDGETVRHKQRDHAAQRRRINGDRIAPAGGRGQHIHAEAAE
jgi:hypothetical protein